VCLDYYRKLKTSKSGAAAGTGDLEGSLHEVTKADIDSDLVYFKPEKVSYKHRSPTALAIFRELALAVVAGTHIQEDADAKPTLTKIDCPKSDKGDVDFDKAENGMIVCALTGANLNKIQSVRLRNSMDATDTKVASGSVSASGDARTGKGSFPLDQLGQLRG
jgi:hypothetical protein